MARVEYNLGNLNKCQCFNCPVHNASECAVNATSKLDIKLPIAALPTANAVQAMYCSEAVGKSSCADLDPQKYCVCGSCPVWQANSLTMWHYCISGSQLEREKPGRTEMKTGM